MSESFPIPIEELKFSKGDKKMDAKSKANFINAVASGDIIPCRECGTRNKSDSKFCISCGRELSPAAAQSSTAAFAAVTEETKPSDTAVASVAQNNTSPTSAFAPVTPQETPAFAVESRQTNAPVSTVQYVEPSKAFALGLPEWSIEPPLVPVRRH